MCERRNSVVDRFESIRANSFFLSRVKGKKELPGMDLKQLKAKFRLNTSNFYKSKQVALFKRTGQNLAKYSENVI